MNVSFRPRRGPAVDWAYKNPLLHEGEIGYETGTGRYKIGDGVRRWNDLPYFINEETTEQFITTQISVLVEPVVQEQVGVILTGLDVATVSDLDAHVNSDLPHPIYDDGPSLLLLYENAKV